MPLTPISQMRNMGGFQIPGPFQQNQPNIANTWSNLGGDDAFKKWQDEMLIARQRYDQQSSVLGQDPLGLNQQQEQQQQQQPQEMMVYQKGNKTYQLDPNIAYTVNQLTGKPQRAQMV